MEKPFYKYYTLWGALGGTALAFLYLKTIGKDKALNLTTTLLIGGVAGAGIGLLGDVTTKGGVKVKEGAENEIPPINEQQVKDFAKELGIDTELQVNSYLLLLNQVPHTQAQKQKVLNVINAQLKAKRDKKWNENDSLSDKKALLLKNYGITDADWNGFQEIISNNLATLLVDTFGK